MPRDGIRLISEDTIGRTLGQAPTPIPSPGSTDYFGRPLGTFGGLSQDYDGRAGMTTPGAIPLPAGVRPVIPGSDPFEDAVRIATQRNKANASLDILHAVLSHSGGVSQNPNLDPRFAVEDPTNGPLPRQNSNGFVDVATPQLPMTMGDAVPPAIGIPLSPATMPTQASLDPSAAPSPSGSYAALRQSLPTPPTLGILPAPVQRDTGEENRNNLSALTQALLFTLAPTLLRGRSLGESLRSAPSAIAGALGGARDKNDRAFEDALNLQQQKTRQVSDLNRTAQQDYQNRVGEVNSFNEALRTTIDDERQNKREQTLEQNATATRFNGGIDFLAKLDTPEARLAALRDPQFVAAYGKLPDSAAQIADKVRRGTGTLSQADKIELDQYRSLHDQLRPDQSPDRIKQIVAVLNKTEKKFGLPLTPEPKFGMTPDKAANINFQEKLQKMKASSASDRLAMQKYGIDQRHIDAQAKIETDYARLAQSGASTEVTNAVKRSNSNLAAIAQAHTAYSKALSNRTKIYAAYPEGDTSYDAINARGSADAEVTRTQNAVSLAEANQDKYDAQADDALARSRNATNSATKKAGGTPASSPPVRITPQIQSPKAARAANDAARNARAKAASGNTTKPAAKPTGKSHSISVNGANFTVTSR